MEFWDPRGTRRLTEIQGTLDRTGLIEFVHEAAQDVWRANLGRYQDDLFDDSFTLSMLSTRNLSNRLATRIEDDPRWVARGVRATKEHGFVVLHVDGLDIRLVKVPHKANRKPSFSADFDWVDSDARLAAARRNTFTYPVAARLPQLEPLFEVEQPAVDEHGVLACRDVFLVWGAERDLPATAGWLGLPTTNDDRWISVLPLWWDAAEPQAVTPRWYPKSA
ncbi:hypothetical protein D5S17_17640 [Pseudonocardiaceae bacterium YIM PH 21723]|nr:hypothetical protein D5S17_17640 [Pseudonocardiaceae bacterium YIM PH 21723]